MWLKIWLMPKCSKKMRSWAIISTSRPVATEAALLDAGAEAVGKTSLQNQQHFPNDRNPHQA